MALVLDPQQQIETNIRCKDGETRIISWNERYLVDNNGKNIGSIVIGRDVTKQKRMEDEIKRYSAHLEELVKKSTKELAESEAQYRRLFESSPISLWEEDFSEAKRYFDELRGRGITDLRAYFTEHPGDVAKCARVVRILAVNEATLRLYGARSTEELLGELDRVLAHESQAELRFREELVALGEGKTQFSSEFDNQTLEGEIRHVSLILSVVPGYEDTLAKVLVSIIDLTERQKMEHRLQQAERFAAIGELAAMVGHDLRNPLQGISGATHLLRQESLTAQERKQMLQLIDDDVKYSNEIVSDLSDYSTEIHLDLAVTDPKKIITVALEAVTVPEKIKVQNQSQEQPAITVDPDRMKRVFVNLITNAVDAMPEGGTLTITSGESKGFVELTINDTGTGLDKRILENLWKPLQTTKAKGMGLGLPIVKRILDAHGGEITLQRAGGQGTTFMVRLPIKPTPSKQMPAT
jgi:PAS domain S-box-containing protein